MTEDRNRPLKVGLLNMMADGALRATERQFRRLLGADAGQDGPRLLMFSLPELDRGAAARAHVEANYLSFEAVRQRGLDALIITGVNVSDPRLDTQPFWEPLIRVFLWAEREVPAVLCSCLATHAVLQFHFGQKRSPLPDKLWGVFRQEVTASDHPLTRHLPRWVDVPHSRHNDLAAEQFAAAGLEVLIQGGQGGVHLAASADRRLTVMQGHPEYDSISLLKEYGREVGRCLSGERGDYPPLPVNYLDREGTDLLLAGRRRFKAGQGAAGAGADFPEAEVAGHVLNRWAGPAATCFTNWLRMAAELQGRGC
jgi:homoserine O-succinyltransferase